MHRAAHLNGYHGKPHIYIDIKPLMLVLACVFICTIKNELHTQYAHLQCAECIC